MIGIVPKIGTYLAIVSTITISSILIYYSSDIINSNISKDQENFFSNIHLAFSILLVVIFIINLILLPLKKLSKLLFIKTTIILIACFFVPQLILTIILTF